MRSLQAESYSPLYAQLMRQIRQDIHRGVYPVGSRIPPEHELEMNYGVSRVTVRRALQELTAEGLLERKQGKGTFVAAPRQKLRDRVPRGFHEACREAGLAAGVRLLSVKEIKADERDRLELQLSEDAAVVACTRLCLADGSPVILESDHFSTAYAYLESADLNGSLYRLLQDYGIRPEKSYYDIAMCPATGEASALLEVPEGTMLLCVHQAVYDQKGRPLHTSRLLIRGDRFTLRI